MKLGTSSPLSFVRAASAVLLLIFGACGGGNSASSNDTTTGGGETPVVLGPPPSFLPGGQRVSVRAQASLVRGLPIAVDVSSAIRATQMWQLLVGTSGLDPIRDLDTLVVEADALYGTRRTALLRYAIEEQDVRAAVTRMAAARGSALDWHEVSGFAVVTLPVDVPVAHSLVLTASHEAVITPTDDVPRIVQVAAEQARRRQAPGDVIDPALAFHADEIVTANTTDSIPPRAGMPPMGRSVTLQLRLLPTGDRMSVALQSIYDDENTAEQARAWIVQNAAAYAQNFLVRSTGLSRPLEVVQAMRDGTTVNASTDLTMDEARRAMGAAALLQTMGGGQ